MDVKRLIPTVLLPLCVTVLPGCESGIAEPLADIAEASSTPEPVAAVAPNGTFVAMTGRVLAASADAFTLDYGGDTVSVEFDDWDGIPEGPMLAVNDFVVVHGYVDQDFLEKRTIEASAVHVRGLGATLYASGADEEDFGLIGSIGYRPSLSMVGEVVEIDNTMLALDTGDSTLNVDTSHLLENPVDDRGELQLDVGDRVRVRGALDHDRVHDWELEASSIRPLGTS